MSDQNKIVPVKGSDGPSAVSSQVESITLAIGERVLYPKLPANEQSKQIKTSEEDEETPELAKANKLIKRQHKKWNRRCRFLSCCLWNQDNKQSIEEVAGLFADFFTGLNLSTSNTVAAFVLLSKNQQAQRQWILNNPNKNNLGVEQFLSGVAIKEDSRFFDITRQEESHILDNLTYYSDYSLATFGYHLQAIDYPCSLCCIFPYMKRQSCCSCDSGRRRARQQIKNGDRGERAADPRPVELTIESGTRHSEDERADKGGKTRRGTRRKQSAQSVQFDKDLPEVIDDDCCGFNEAAAGLRLAEYNCELIYITYKSDVHKTPFLVAVDHSRRSIVVAIRGSMRLSDAITDFHFKIDKIPLEDCPNDWLGHRGMISAAVYVKTLLIQERILERALNCRPDLGSDNYDLVLCGHSLGAGTAAILGLLMRPLYPSLKAYLYSPPGGILSLPVVEYTKEFAVSITLGYDLIARIGLAQLERLRYQVLISLKTSRKSPGGVTLRALCPSMCCARNQAEEYDPEQSIDFLYGTNDAPIDHNNTQIPFQAQPQMLFMPGRVIHIVKNHSFKPSTRRPWSGPVYQGVWTKNESYDRILVEDGWFADHMPWNLTLAMNMLRCKSLPSRFSAIKSTQSSPSKKSP